MNSQVVIFYIPTVDKDKPNAVGDVIEYATDEGVQRSYQHALFADKKVIFQGQKLPTERQS